MYIIMGGTGHVGGAAASFLLDRGEQVTIITRNASRAGAWARRGAVLAEVDVHDVTALRRVFQTGKRAFLLNPPADPATDTDVEERATVASIVAALDGSGLEKVVAESTYGAQPGERCGDLNVLYELEEGLLAQPIPAAIIRAAYYFSNWDAMLELARSDGKIATMYPPHLKIPMVAPIDLGKVAGELLMAPLEEIGTHYVEGPEPYSSADVAQAFADALGREVSLSIAPRESWVDEFKKLGFSDPAAQSYARMTGVTFDGDYDMPQNPIRGSVRLQDFMREPAG
ncbi:uncharacterized protein YbjT (DUF2867 family) [Devosia sp. UYZn731]|uniref:NmrA family NAD(P)-binding protein n=1 Tax=Devosia sp. UYZn731 TaxID=3156345 RepID=UPI003390D89C